VVNPFTLLNIVSAPGFIHSYLILLFLINVSSAKYPGEKTARSEVFGLNSILLYDDDDGLVFMFL